MNTLLASKSLVNRLTSITSLDGLKALDPELTAKSTFYFKLYLSSVTLFNSVSWFYQVPIQIKIIPYYLVINHVFWNMFLKLAIKRNNAMFYITFHTQCMVLVLLNLAPTFLTSCVCYHLLEQINDCIVWQMQGMSYYLFWDCSDNMI